EPMVRILFPPAASPLRTRLDSLRIGTAGRERRDGRSTDVLCARATSTSPSPLPRPRKRRRLPPPRRSANRSAVAIGITPPRSEGALQRRGALPPESLDDWDRRLRQRRQARHAGERHFDRRRQLATLPLGVGRLALGEFRHDLGGK